MTIIKLKPDATLVNENNNLVRLKPNANTADVNGGVLWEAFLSPDSTTLEETVTRNRNAPERTALPVVSEDLNLAKNGERMGNKTFTLRGGKVQTIDGVASPVIMALVIADANNSILGNGGDGIITINYTDDTDTPRVRVLQLSVDGLGYFETAFLVKSVQSVVGTGFDAAGAGAPAIADTFHMGPRASDTVHQILRGSASSTAGPGPNNINGGSGDATYVEADSASDQRIYVKMVDPVAQGQRLLSISAVQFRAYIKNVGTTAVGCSLIFRTDPGDADEIILTNTTNSTDLGAYSLMSVSLATNPFTAAPWTVQEIVDLEVGILFHGESVPTVPKRCAHIQVLVNGRAGFYHDTIDGSVIGNVGDTWQAVAKDPFQVPTNDDTQHVRVVAASQGQVLAFEMEDLPPEAIAVNSAEVNVRWTVRTISNPRGTQENDFPCAVGAEPRSNSNPLHYLDALREQINIGGAKMRIRMNTTVVSTRFAVGVGDPPGGCGAFNDFDGDNVGYGNYIDHVLLVTLDGGSPITIPDINGHTAGMTFENADDAEFRMSRLYTEVDYDRDPTGSVTPHLNLDDDPDGTPAVIDADRIISQHSADKDFVFSFETMPDAASVDSVTIRVRAKTTSGSTRGWQMFWRVNGNDTFEPEQFNSTFQTKSFSRATNPETGVAWTIDDINNLQVGWRAKGENDFFEKDISVLELSVAFSNQTSSNNNLGHGSLGLRARMRDFVSLIDSSETEKTVIVELQPIQEINGWSPDLGGAFIANVDFIFDGVRRDIIDVRSLVDATLKRVETIAENRTTPGTFFYDPELEIEATGFWDDGITEWDGGLKWDQFTQLHVHLSDGSDPDDTTIVAVHSFGFAPKGVVQPQFGPRKLSNGGFELFTGGEADDWITFEGTGFAEWDDGVVSWDDGTSTWDELLQALFKATDPFNVRKGLCALGMATAGGGITSVFQEVGDAPTEGFTPGKIYRYYGAYKTEGDATAQIVISNDLITPGDSIFEDGRSVATGTNNILDLQGTGGEWRRFSIDFLAFDTVLSFLLRAVSGGGPGQVFWDDVDVRRIWSFNYFEPRVMRQAIPETRTGTHDVFFGRKNVGVGSVKLINGDDFFYGLIPELEWMNQNCIVKWGGEFPPLTPGDPSQEILLEDYERAFTGLIQSQEVTDLNYSMRLQDLRSFFHATLPNLIYDIDVTPAMDPQLQGKPRPLLFGRKENITPPRLGLTGFGYGLYEIADTSEAPNGIFSVDQVFAYENQEAALALDPASRLLLVEGVDYSVDLDAGTISILNNPGPFRVTIENNAIDWRDGAGALNIFEAFIPVGLFTAQQLAAQMEAVMEPVSGNDYQVSYNRTLQKFVFSRISGGAGVTFVLRTNNGANKETSVWPLIGFDKSANTPVVASGVDLIADEVVFSDPDTQNVIRCDAQGFKDNNTGTFTGFGEGIINIGADMLRVILVNYMKKSFNVIDEATFIDARTSAPEEIAAYFGEEISTKDIFDALEFSNAANIIVDADGIVFYKVNISNVAGIPPLVDDKDIEEHVEEFDVADVFQTIRIAFDQSPSTGVFEAIEAIDTSVVPRLGRPDSRTFETFLKESTDARDRAQEFLDLANAAPRKIVLNLLGGRFIRKEIGDKLNLSIGRATGLNATIQNEIFRIVSIRKRPQDGKVNVEVTDNVPT